MVHDSTDTSDFFASGTFAPFSGAISINEWVISITLCATDQLPLHFQT